jgi:hypothetical protein
VGSLLEHGLARWRTKAAARAHNKRQLRRTFAHYSLKLELRVLMRWATLRGNQAKREANASKCVIRLRHRLFLRWLTT